MPPLLARYRVDETAQRVKRAVRDSESPPVGAGIAGGDRVRLRGLPCVARDVAGEMFGTRPDRIVVDRLSR